MVVDPEGTAQITADVAKSDLSNAWGRRFRNIDEVTKNLFLAGFNSEYDMMSVLKGQPWTLRGYNLLLEIYVPHKHRDDYAFQYIEASVRLYDIPRSLRTEARITEAIQ